MAGSLIRAASWLWGADQVPAAAAPSLVVPDDPGHRTLPVRLEPGDEPILVAELVDHVAMTTRPWTRRQDSTASGRPCRRRPRGLEWERPTARSATARNSRAAAVIERPSRRWSIACTPGELVPDQLGR